MNTAHLSKAATDSKLASLRAEYIGKIATGIAAINNRSVYGQIVGIECCIDRAPKYVRFLAILQNGGLNTPCEIQTIQIQGNP